MPRSPFRASALLVLLSISLPLAAERRIALIVDTSGSMNTNDPPRYAVQISKILSDLAEDQDKVAVIRLPVLRGADALIAQFRGQDCDVAPDPKLMVVLNGSQRAQFKSRIDDLLQYDGPTYFGAPLRDAIPFLGDDPKVQRLLLLISDAQEGFDGCNQQYTEMLQRFESTGAMVALIKMGGHQDDFQGNPAIQFREDVIDSRKLIGAVAQVYQRFLGSRKPQTGTVSGNISVEIAPHVKEAFLVVAADSPLGQLASSPGNPHADQVDTDYRAGGLTEGVNRQGERGYRIIRLTNPAQGRYNFSTPPGTSGGWMLIEDYALAVRLVSQTPVTSDSTSTVQLEVVDERNGQRVTDGPTLADLKIDGKIDSSIVSLTNNGSGIFTVEHKFGSPGTTPMQLHLHGSTIDRTFDIPVTVEKKPEFTGKQEPQIPNHGRVGSPMTITVKWSGNGTPPDRMIAEVDGRRVELPPDKGSSDHVYTAKWTPDTPGQKKIHVTAEGGTPVQPMDVDVNIEDRPKLPQAGELSLGHGVPANLGKLHTHDTGQGEARLLGGRVDHDAEIEISTDFSKRHSTLQIQTPDGWQTLSSAPVSVKVTSNDPLRWPVRLEVGKCPEACKEDEAHRLMFLARFADGSTQRTEVPLRFEIVPDPWYICWKTEILTGLAALIGMIILYGFISPYRFPRRAGVQISPAEDPSEGFFFPLRAARGSGAGFYRDARLYITEDFRVQGKKTGGFVRLRADRKLIRIRPENGRSVYRQSADGDWEILNSHQETIARPGSLYRNDQRTLFFEIRTK